MPYTIKGSEFDDFKLPASSPSPLATNSDSHGVSQSNYGIQASKFQFIQTAIQPETYILEATYAMAESVMVDGQGDSPLLEIQFNLSPQGIAYNTKKAGRQFSRAMSANISFLAPEENQAQILFERKHVYQTFDIHIPINFLDKYSGESAQLDLFIEEIARGRSATFAKENVRATAAMREVIQSMRTCPFDGLTRKIFLEAKVYELIALLHERSNSPTIGKPFRKQDEEAIHQAAELIRNNLEHPYTIVELAKQVGINQTKLKDGFRNLYAQTVFGYLQQHRMQKARHYLMDSSLSVEEIAQHLGYQNMSNFSAAFKKTHGVSPLKMRLNA